MRSISIEHNEAQKQALVDLLILGMYADHNLTSAEDDYLQRLLDSFDFGSDYARQVFVDAAFTRTRGHTGSTDSIREYIEQLAQSFPSAEERQQVYEALDELLSSDGAITDDEKWVLRLVREVFETSAERGLTFAQGSNGSWRRK
jgi:uncharacterized tellurite resistance protein B-like protein